MFISPNIITGTNSAVHAPLPCTTPSHGGSWNKQVSWVYLLSKNNCTRIACPGLSGGKKGKWGGCIIKAKGTGTVVRGIVMSYPDPNR